MLGVHHFLGVDDFLTSEVAHVSLIIVLKLKVLNLKVKKLILLISTQTSIAEVQMKLSLLY